MSTTFKIKWNHYGKIRILNLAEKSFEALIEAVKSTKVGDFCQELFFIDNDNDEVIVECDVSMKNMVEYFETKGTTPLIYTKKDEETLKFAIPKSEISSLGETTNSSFSILDVSQRQENNSFPFLFQSSQSNGALFSTQSASDSSQIPKPQFVGNDQHRQSQEMEPIKEKINRLALHSTSGFVGNFYDAKNDQFIKEVQGERFKHMEVVEMLQKESLYAIGTLDEFNDRFDRLQVDVDQKLSIVSNLAETQTNGFGKFFTTIFVGDILEECGEKAFGLVKIWHKKSCKLNLTDPTIRTQVISQQPLLNVTHVVKAVIYGFSVAAVFIPSNNEVKMVELKKAVQLILRAPNLVTNQQKRQQNILEKAGHSVKVCIFADPQLAIQPQISLNDALELLAPKCPLKCPPLPIQYELVPIVHLMKSKYLKPSNHFSMAIPNPELIELFMFNVQAIKSIDAFYTKMAEFMQKYPYCFSNQLFTSFVEKCSKEKKNQQKYYEDLKICLTTYRNKEVAQLEHYNELFGEQERITSMSYELQPLFRKIKFAELLMEKGVPYLGNGNFHLEKTLNEIGSKICFVFFCCASEEDLAENASNRQLFFRLIERGEKCIFADMELANWVEARKTSSVAKFWQGQEIVNDYLKEEDRKLRSCIAKIQKLEKQIFEDIYESDGLVHFECSCPMANKFGGKCLDEEFLWECDDCGQFLAFSSQSNQMVDYFYCQCGQARIEDIHFRCKYSEHHGPKFVPFPRELLASICGQFNFGEKNILILGESGVGKSTWINALANYMTYRNMEDALNTNNPVCLIPSQFTIADEQMNPKLVQIGKIDENDDEILEIGKSATKRPKAHVFPYKGGKIRLIDTPGIGDTEGIDEDKANFASTLSYISNFEELHGICILLKPNNARLSLIFRYCINELLSHLHKNAARNIIFCFTNTRGTLFKPGDTLSSLRVLLNQMEKNQGVCIELSQNTVFCMDNEAFRFICAAYNNVKFDEKDQLNFAESWRRSESETNRLLAHINSLPPHTTKETVSLNEARRIITTLSQPIAIIAKIIQDNITTMADEEKRLATLTVTEGDIRKKLMTPFIYIKYDILQFPQTICASESCTEFRIGPNGKPHIYYKTVCHDVCFLNGSIENRFPNQQLRWCMIFKATNGMNCCKCGCPWSIHMNSRYKQIECSEMIEDPEVKRLLEEGKDKKAVINRAIQSASERVREFEAEQQKINEIAARFGSFLKRHALMPYNDAIEAYVELAIRDARQIAEQTKDFRKVEGLETYLRIYKEQGRIIDESLNDGTEEIKPEDIKRYFQELIGLKLMGQNIKQLFDAETIVQKKQMEYLENSYTPPPVLRKTISNANKIIFSPKSPECLRKEDELMNPNPFGEPLSPITTSLEENLVKTPQKLKEFAVGQNDGPKTPPMMTTKLAEVSDPRRSREKLMEMTQSIGNGWEEQKKTNVTVEKKIKELGIDSNPPASPPLASNGGNEAFFGGNNEEKDRMVEPEGGVEDMDFGSSPDSNNGEKKIIEKEKIQAEEEEVVIIGEKKGQTNPMNKLDQSLLAKRKVFQSCNLSLDGNNSKRTKIVIQDLNVCHHPAGTSLMETVKQKVNPKINIAKSEDADLNMARINYIPLNVSRAFTAPIIPQTSVTKSKAIAQFEKELAPTRAFPTFLNFCECTDVKLCKGAMSYPWQSLPHDKIHLAYDMIPNTKRKFHHSSGANAAARALILCGMEHKWGDEFAKFSEECPRGGMDGTEEPKITRVIGTNSTLAQTNPSPWALTDYMCNFMEKAGNTQWIARVFTYNLFLDCASAISEDIRLDKPVLICYSIQMAAGINQTAGEWLYANVIAIKCQSMLAQDFVLLAVDRTIEHRCYENLNRLICNKIEGKMQPTAGEEQGEPKPKTFTIIRFQKK